MKEEPPVRHSDPAIEHARASAILRAMAEQATGDTVSIGQMMAAFGERAFGLLLIVFCVPNLVPAPGIGSLFGIPLLLIALQMMVGRSRPWLPRAIESKSIGRGTFLKMIRAVEPRMRKIESVLKPRLLFLFSSGSDRLIGLFVALCAISIIIPFPGTNFLPAVAVILISLAVMQEDGIYLALGAVIGSVGLAYTTILVGGLAWAGIKALARFLGG